MLCSSELTSDPAQLSTIEALNSLHDELTKHKQKNILTWFTKRPSPKGIYIWGSVGRGKTMLMDIFCRSMPYPVTRLHFHRFMKQVHHLLQVHSGTPDPLRTVASELTKPGTIICFDEFFVDNIADAMLLSRLLKHLFSYGVTLIATSNQHPEQLYPDGLHRDRFLPAIELLKTHTTILSLEGSIDHRLQANSHQQSWFTSVIEAQKTWFQLALEPSQPNHIRLCHRSVDCISTFEDKWIWFSFEQICGEGRSSMDYIELAEKFDLILLTNLPKFHGQAFEQIKARGTEDGIIATSTGERHVQWSNMDDPARRFISLVDELYDRRINLVICAETSENNIYPTDGALSFPFQRTLSRLYEMSSINYQQTASIR